MELPRVNEAVKLLKKFSVKTDVYVDLGCNDGSITVEIARAVNAKTAYCIDIDSEALVKARGKGLITYEVDLSTGKIPLSNESVDLVTAFEVIEHLINPDNMLRESNRILRHGGVLLITTPNLASWVNRIALLLGYQPYNVEVSTEIVAGVPWKARTFAKPSGHIRPYTLRALKELLKYHGFRIIDIKGAPGVEPKELYVIDHILSKIPSLSRRLIILAQKP